MTEQWAKYLELSKSFQKKKLSNSDESLECNDKPCGKCNSQGKIIYYDENGYAFTKECECGFAKRQKNRDVLKYASVPEKYKDIRLKDIKLTYGEKNDKMKSVIEMIRYWIESIDEQKKTGQGFYFWSETKGSGKTMTVCALANELCDRGIYAKFSTSPRMLQEIKNSWNREEGISESELLRQFSNADILIIDDFGTEQAKDWVSERFYEIINNRYTNNKITLFTSNYLPENLPYGDRISNRVIEKNIIVEFPNVSVREKISTMRNMDAKKMFPGAFK